MGNPICLRSVLRALLPGVFMLCGMAGARTLERFNVSAGAGGHAGSVNPFALLPEIRRIFDGTVVLAGCIADGRGIAAARMLGADLACIDTRFMATVESLGPPGKDTIPDADATDAIHTDRVSGVDEVLPARELCRRLANEYADAVRSFTDRTTFATERLRPT